MYTRDKFLLAKSTKNIVRGVNFTNLKTPSGYIAKPKPQESLFAINLNPRKWLCNLAK